VSTNKTDENKQNTKNATKTKQENIHSHIQTHSNNCSPANGSSTQSSRLQTITQTKQIEKTRMQSKQFQTHSSLSQQTIEPFPRCLFTCVSEEKTTPFRRSTNYCHHTSTGSTTPPPCSHSATRYYRAGKKNTQPHTPPTSDTNLSSSHAVSLPITSVTLVAPLPPGLSTREREMATTDPRV